MKRTLLALALLVPAIASAQIYPLEVYATVYRAGSNQQFKFMRSPAQGVYVGLCNLRKDGTYLCDLAKNGTYKTAEGITFSTKNMGQLYSANGKDRCTYSEAGSLDCDNWSFPW